MNNLEDTFQRDDFYKEKLIKISRHAKVVKGGRVFGFSALTVVGNCNGKIGMGRGKSKEIPIAIQKAMDNAKKNLISVNLNKKTLFYKINSIHCSSRVIMMPAVVGTGIIANFVMHSVFEVMGVDNVIAKCIGSSNPNNIIIAMLKGLSTMKSPNNILLSRGKSINNEDF